MSVRRVLRAVLYLSASAWVGLFLWGMGRLRTHGLADRLEKDASGLGSREAARPLHVDGRGLPGTFGALAEAPLAALTAQALASDDVELCRAVRQGEKRFATVRPACLAALARAEAPLSALLRATHAAKVAPPRALAALAPAQESAPSLNALLYAGKLGALRVRAQLAAGDAAGALASCLDLLALGRDAGYGTGLSGRVHAAQLSELAFAPCAASLEAAPAAAKDEAAAALSRIGDGLSPLSSTLRTWATLRLVEAFGPLLGERLQRMPPRARALALRGAPVPTLTPLQALRLKDYWHDAQGRMDALAQAAALPAPRRFAEVRALCAPNPQRLNALSRVGLPDEVYLAVEADGRARAELELLREAALAEALRARRGAWPTVEELGPRAELLPVLVPHGASALLKADGAPRGGLSLTLRAGAGS